MVACPSPPYFNKSLEEGQGIPPSSSYTSQPAPHLLCPPSLARPPPEVEWLPSPRPVQLHPLVHADRDLLLLGIPSACNPGTSR